MNKLINYLISQTFLVTYITTFEPETPVGHPKYQKTWIVVCGPQGIQARPECLLFVSVEQFYLFLTGFIV